MPKRVLTAALAAVLLLAGCQPAGHAASGTASPSASAGTPRLTAAQRKAAVLALSDLPAGYQVRPSDDGNTSSPCMKRIGALLSGSVSRLYADIDDGLSVSSSVETVPAGTGAAAMRRYRKLTKTCGDFAFDDQGFTAKVTFDPQPVPTLLDEGAGFVEQLVYNASSQIVTVDVIVFRYGDNIGTVGLGTQGAAHNTADAIALAHTAAAKLRGAAR